MNPPRVRLADVAQINPRLAASDRPSLDTAVSFVGMAAVSQETMSIVAPEDRTYAEVRKGFTPFSRGDILLAKITPCFENGKFARSSDLPREHGFGSTEFHVVRPGDSVDDDYLFHLLRTPLVRSAGESRMKGAAGQRRVPAEYFVDLDIPLPSLPEQERIAGILDTADALRVKRRESIAQLDALVQSTFLEMFGDPIGNPKQLDTASLGELGRWRSGGTPPRTRPDYFSGKIPWFSSGELNSRFVTASEENISETAIAETSAKLVESMSVMIGMYDTAALKTSVALVPCSCNQAVAFAKLDETKAHPVYVEAALRIGRESFKRLQRGVRQKNLNLTILRSIRLPIPSLDAQAAFATVADRCEALSAVHLQHLTELDTLFASLQSRAFAGEL